MSMTAAILRKARHVLDDPVLRRWLFRRIAGLEPPAPKFTTGAPPYLRRLNSSNNEQRSPRWTGQESVQRFSPVDGTVKIDLPGLTIDVSSDNPGALFDRDYPDLETLLAAHRFAGFHWQGQASIPAGSTRSGKLGSADTIQIGTDGRGTRIPLLSVP